jgi:hypothetical protein
VSNKVDLFSGRVKKVPSGQVSESRYTWIRLSETEPDLGLPPINDSILTASVAGIRTWSSAKVTQAGDMTVKDLVISGDLTVNGTTTTINTTTLDVEDLNITVAKGAANAAAADGAGITVDGANATILYRALDDKWVFNKSLDVNGLSIDSAQDSLTINGDGTITGDLEVRGGDITTNQTTFNLLNSTATTVNFAGAATIIEIGAASGTTNINNDLDVDGDLNIDGGDLTVGTATFNLANTTATTVNFAGAATTLEIGAATGTTNINNNLDLSGSLKIYNVTSTGATGTEKIVFSESPTFTGTVIMPNARGISIGDPTLGILDGAVDMETSTSVTNGVAQLNQILTLLVPLEPPDFPNSQNLTISGTTQRLLFVTAGSQQLNGNSISAPAAGTVVHVIRSNSLSTNTISSTGPATAGTVTVNRNGSAAVIKTLTYGNTTQVITATITNTTLNSNVVSYTYTSSGVLFPGYLIQTGSSGAFGGLANNTYYYITAVTTNTISLSAYNFTTGDIGSAFSATSTASGTVSFTTVSDNGTITENNTSLILSNNIAFPLDTPGFHEIVDVRVSGSSVPAGWNTVQITHSQAGSTTIGATTSNTGIWYYDDTSGVAPSFASQTFAVGSANLTYSSTIPHYNSSTTFNIGFTVTWNAGQTGHSSTASNILTTAAVGPWTTAGNKTYTNFNYSTLPSTTVVISGAGPNSTTFTNNIVSGFGAWTTTTTVPVYTADNSYQTATSALPALNAVILYKTGTTGSTTFIEESNIHFASAVGSGSGAAARVVNPDGGVANQDTPTFSANPTLFNSQTGTFYDTDATVVGTGTNVNSLRHNLTNYSTGYLPAGPNLSTRTAGDAQYFTFRFVRTNVSKFSITYTTTTGVAAIYCAMPGTGGVSGTTSTLNKWLDLSIDNSLPNGCALGGNLVPSATGTRTYNCSFGTLSSTNATNNEIWVRIKLTQGQSITSLYLGASIV